MLALADQHGGELLAGFEVGGVVADAPQKLAHVTGLLGLAGEADLRLQLACHARLGGLVRDGLQDGQGFVEVAGVGGEAGEGEQHGGVLRVDAVRLLEHLHRGLLFTLLQEAHGLFQQQVRLAHDVLVDEFADCALRLRAHELVDGAAVLEQHHGRQAADAELGGQHLLLVGVDIGQVHLAVIALHHALEQRLEDLAGLAPCCPEIDQYGALVRGLDDLLGKVLFGDVKDEATHRVISNRFQKR